MIQQSHCWAYTLRKPEGKETRVPQCQVLTVASWLAYIFFRRQVRRSCIPNSWTIFQFVVIHTVKGFSVVNEAEVDIFLKFSCFFCDQMDIGNLISGSSAFSKSSLNIWKFRVHILLKPGLENFECYFASLWDEYNCMVLWTFFGIAVLSDWQENTFSSPVATGEFSKFALILTSLVTQTVKRMPAIALWETRVRSLGQEDPLEKEMTTHSSTLAWKIPWMKEPGSL